MKRDVFQAIADPTRRAILILIAAQAMTPNMHAGKFDTSRQSVSKHIRILTECRLLTRKKTGREIFYHLNSQKINEIDIWLDQFKRLLENRFDQLDQVLTNLKSNEDENQCVVIGFFR
jgi:DNA-binding transcriptional ArsR family regulator